MLSNPILRGVLWMCLAALLYSSAAGAVRWLSPDYNALELNFFRNVVALIVLVPLVVREGLASLATRRPGAHVTRMLFSWVGNMALFFALAKMPIADVGALIFTQPLLTMALAIVVLRQKAGWRVWLAGMVGFAGALVILRPGITEVSTGSLLVLTAAFTFACASTAIKSLSRTETTLAITLYMNLAMLPLSFVAALFVWKWPAWHDAFAMFALGFLYTGAQYAIAKAISAADARVVQPFDFLRLPFATVIGFLLFRELPDAWTWAGAAIIFLASTYAFRVEAQNRRIPATVTTR
jgi:drug/metabolite transporter (DMT)-like permease